MGAYITTPSTDIREWEELNINRYDDKYIPLEYLEILSKRKENMNLTENRNTNRKQPRYQMYFGRIQSQIDWNFRTIAVWETHSYTLTWNRRNADSQP